ncbi:SDR family NAD(P)-dependent oxidoreductase [Rarobacter incanus]|uniref:NAD(P)-dependent dehydrogenase (Short-subunit alcohol dehydrogenase family) n=1 Tax=Rarobacter incanus TaxID=153494 RepID=A0A542SMG9_9MICO|nr:SDR family NAD(P)-dependent oxidoreductase [Rarobacter incanus]TQK75768.1 NAD(P)-dependent dehydrogenase (short-subunit alcohol dehydrogenase family) [Rarobacter incanus]
MSSPAHQPLHPQQPTASAESGASPVGSAGRAQDADLSGATAPTQRAGRAQDADLSGATAPTQRTGHARDADLSGATAPTQRAGHARDADPSIADADFATFLRVIEQVGSLPSDHPQLAAARRATSALFKAAKKQRRTERRDAINDADRSVIESTATGSMGRIDDETAGIPLTSSVRGAIAGTLKKPRPCYICKQDYTQVDAFYHQLCPTCAAFNHAKRDARTDLTGKRALLTGGRAKIGMYIALRLLRDGAHTTITTRFPKDAARRFAAMPDSAAWLDRLTIVGIDLRDPAQVVHLADIVAAAGPLDILINNAAQTVRRTAGAYQQLVQAESQPLLLDSIPTVHSLGNTSSAHPHALAGAVSELQLAEKGDSSLRDVAKLALTAQAASMEELLAGTSIDAGGLIPDTVDHNSWVAAVQHVDPLELLEVQLCNQTAPFILISRLRASMAASPARRTYVVNVSAMEGVFSRGYKGPGHPHTNMSKAALNMLTRTSAAEMFESDRILMTAVDTGWITDERPHPTKIRMAQEGFHAPLDLVDGAARVYDPIVRGEAGEDVYGCFLKDYSPSKW